MSGTGWERGAETLHTGLFNLSPPSADTDSRTIRSTEESPALLMHAIRRRLAADEGMSIVEVLVAIVILGVVLSAAANALASSLFVMAQNENRTKATALSGEEIENLRVLPWELLGFYEDDFDEADWDDNPTRVQITDGPTRPVDAIAPLPTESLTRGGVTFDVVREITWEKNDLAVGDEHYKRIRVTVAWSDRQVRRSITVETDRAPNPDEQEASTFALSVVEAQPSIVKIDSDGGLATGELFELSAVTSAWASHVHVTWVNRNGDEVPPYYLAGSGDGKNWAKTIAPTDSYTFPNGEVLFTFSASRQPDPDHVEIIGTKLVRFLQDLDFMALTASQSSLCLPIGTPAPELSLTAVVNGLVESDEVVATWDDEEALGDFDSASVSGSTYVVRIPEGSYGAVAGTTTFTATATRLSEATPVSVTETVTVTVSRYDPDDPEDGC